MAFDIDKIFNSSKLTYWSCFGTLLGCIRQQGLIQWDDDIDLCVPEEEIDLLLALC